jgi:hypothetical protein
MAHQTPIARWLLDNRSRLKPSFVRLDWSTRYFSGVSDFASNISFNGIEAFGRGVDFDQNLALEKSAAEAIERYICLALNIDSVGLAVSGESGAMAHAENEALERYFFGEHRRLQKPLVRLTSAHSEFPLVEEIIRKFEHPNSNFGSLSFFKMATPIQYHGYAATIRVNGKVCFLGLSLHSDPRRALFRAFVEAITNFARFRDEPTKFESERRANPDAWNCDPDFLSNLNGLFELSTEAATSLTMPRLVSTQLDISKLDILSGCPISPIKVVAT